MIAYPLRWAAGGVVLAGCAVWWLAHGTPDRPGPPARATTIATRGGVHASSPGTGERSRGPSGAADAKAAASGDDPAAAREPEPLPSSGVTSSSPAVPCNADCRQVVELFRGTPFLSDEALEDALAQVDDFVGHFRQRPDVLESLLRLTPSLDAAQRRLLIETVHQLGPPYRQRLGAILSDSTLPAKRIDGIQLLAADVIDGEVVRRLTGILASETDEGVLDSAVRALNRPDLLRRDPLVLQTLRRVQSLGIDEAIRGEALLARANLSEDTDALVDDAVQAVRSGGTDYAGYGARALERILTRVSLDAGTLGPRTEGAVRQLMADLMSAEFDGLSREVRRTLDQLNARFL